ncbi:MAG: NAD(P)/FAD-dependent oxidoreductase, partial [Verrucomicrobiales bacterium]
GHTTAHAIYRFNDQGKGEIVGEQHGLVKLIIDAETREILGAAGMGPHLIDYSHTMMVALSQRLTIDQFVKIPSYHPTLGEIWSYAAEEFF